MRRGVFTGKSIFDNIGLKLVSLLFALLLWFFVSGKGRTYNEISYTLPLEFKNIPGNLIITNDFKDKVEIRLSGPTTLLNSVRSEKLKYTIDLANISSGESSFSINPANIDLLRGLKVTKISPSKIDLVLERIIEKAVPVILILTGELPEGYKILSQKVEPVTVEIKGAMSEVNNIQSIPTVEVDLTGQTTSIKRALDLVFSGIYYSEVVGKKNITATIEIGEDVLEKEFKGIDVEVRGLEGESYTIEPEKIDVVINGTYLNFKNFIKESIVVYVDANDVEKEPQILNPKFELPVSFTVKKMTPETFKVSKVVNKKKKGNK